MRKRYFKPVPGAPEPLRMTTERHVRFEEVGPEMLRAPHISACETAVADCGGWRFHWLA